METYQHAHYELSDSNYPYVKNNDLLMEPNLQRTISNSNFKIQELGNFKRLRSTTLDTLYNVNLRTLLSINNQDVFPKLNLFSRLIFSLLLGLSFKYLKV